MMSHLRCVVLFVCAALIAGGGCRRGPKPLPLATAAEARQTALGSAVIPSLDRSFERVDAIAKALSLPFDGQSQRKSLIESTKAPQALLSALRTDAPLAVVAFPAKQKDKEPELVTAIMAKSPDTLKAAMAALGQPIAARQDAAQFKIGDDSPWLLSRQGTLLVATSLDTLVGGGALALELARAGDDDVTVRVSPEALAKSQGTDLKTALAGLLTTASESFKQTPGKSPVPPALVEGLLKSVAERVAEVDEVALSLRLDVIKGATLRLAATPQKGSKLGAMIGQNKPFALDGRVVPETDALALMAFSGTDLLQKVWSEVRPLLAVDKDGAEAAGHIDTFVSAWTSGGTGAMSVVDNRLRMGGVYALKPGSDGAALLSAMEGLMNGRWYKGLLASTDVKTKIRMKRETDALVVSTTSEPAKNMPAAMTRALEGMGLTAQTYAMVVGDDALFYASGKDAAATARGLVSAAPRKPVGLCAQAVQESAGADGFFYIDLAPFVAMGAGAMGGGANPFPPDLNLPLWLSYRGGQAATVELRVPMQLAKGVAALVPMFMGLGMGMGMPSQPAP